MCSKMCMLGMEISKSYYEQYGRPMLEEKFSEYMPQIAVGLVGEGSDCYGFDDGISMDHDWGPDFCIWLPKKLYEEIGEKLQKAYEELPSEFMGYKRSTTKTGRNRRGVLSIEGFYGRLLGIGPGEKFECSNIPWNILQDYQLAAATNGQVFYDGLGTFTHIREELLKGYPENILYLKLAEDVAKISQTGQYNYARMLKRGDRITADIMLSEFIKQVMILAHHMNNQYPMHDKWLYKNFCNRLEFGDLLPLLKQVHSSFSLKDEEAMEVVPELTEAIGSFLAKEMYDRNIISDISAYLDEHTEELVHKAQYAVLSDEELVELIAKTEFEAFDKVQNEGGRASCQNDWVTFSIMRKSQYLTWNRTMLLQYIYDFKREFALGHNLITEKYGRMMESTAPDRYEEIKEHFSSVSQHKKMIIENIVAIQIQMLEVFGEKHPKLAGNTRSFHTYEDNIVNTSYETYLRGEISTYSDKMLQLYGAYVVSCLKENVNIAEQIINNTAMLYGYSDLEAFEKRV